VTTEEYATTQQQLLFIGTLTDNLDLDGFLDAISLAHAGGPIMDPTIYRRGMRRLQGIEQLARATREMQRAVAALRSTVIAEAPNAG